MPKGQCNTGFQHLIIEKVRTDSVFFYLKKKKKKKKNCQLCSIGSWQAGTVWTDTLKLKEIGTLIRNQRRV